MPLFAIYAVDKPDALNLRLANRDAHLAHVRSLGGRLKLAGPLLTADSMAGSLIIAEFQDQAAAEAHMANDPYSQAGVFEDVQITGWRQVLPD